MGEKGGSVAGLDEGSKGALCGIQKKKKRGKGMSAPRRGKNSLQKGDHAEKGEKKRENGSCAVAGEEAKPVAWPGKKNRRLHRHRARIEKKEKDSTDGFEKKKKKGAHGSFTLRTLRKSQDRNFVFTSIKIEKREQV